jgi:Cytosol aminopeptidase family, N-terminal domain
MEGGSMKQYSVLRLFALFVAMGCVPGLMQKSRAQTSHTATQAKPAEIRISNAPIPTRILVQSPADTDTELQIICLFRSDPSNTLHGSLIETNEKLRGLLDQIRKPTLFRGELGETILINPAAGEIGAKKLLIIGLGDSQTFTPQRMELVGSIAYRESNRLGIAHPIFAPTILDGGVTKYTTGQASEQFIAGFMRAARTEKLLKDAGSSPGQVIKDLTYLAGTAHAPDTQQGIEKALAAEAGK